MIHYVTAVVSGQPKQPCSPLKKPGICTSVLHAASSLPSAARSRSTQKLGHQTSAPAPRPSPTALAVETSSMRPARHVGRSRSVPRASTAEPESPPESAAHESVAKEPLHLPFQPRGAHAALRAFLGMSAKSGRRASAQKKGVHGVDFFQTRPNPGAGSEAHDDKSSPPAGRLARRRAARREIVAEQNCDFAAAPVRGVQNFNVAASHIAREYTPLRISPERRLVACLARG